MTVKQVNSSLSGESRVSLQKVVRAYLEALDVAGKSKHTQKAYRLELQRLQKVVPQSISDVTVASLRSFLFTRAGLAKATQARTQAALASFFAWAFREEFIDVDLMPRIERIRPSAPLPRGIPPTNVQQVLNVIPKDSLRDRVLFHLIATTGLRAGEAVGLHVEDLDMSPDNEHLYVLGKGGRRRTILLDDPRLLMLLRRYLRRSNYTHGALFRAEKNGKGGCLGYDAARSRWRGYCALVDINCTLHQLRHTHATELINDGVSLVTIRKRLGHASMQTTLRYAEQSDSSADAEIRAWRRSREGKS